MGENEFLIQIIAKLNQQLTKRQIKADLKGMDNTMYTKVIAKLSTTLSKRQLKKDLKQLNDLYVKIGADLKIDRNLKSKLQNRIKELQNSISDIELKTKVNSRNANSEIETARRTVQAKVNKTSVSFNLEVKKNKAIADIEYIGKRFSKLFSNVSAKQKYENILAQAYSISDKSDLSSVRSQISTFTSELKANDLASKSLGDTWKSLIDRSKNLFSAASIVTTIFSQVKNAISTTIELDTAMTDLQKVSDDIVSRDQFSGLLTKWNRLAQNLSVTTESLISSMEAWSKIGFDLDMSEQLAQITTIFEKTAEISNEKANATLISAAQAFTEIDDLGVDDYVKRVEAVGNKVNAVGNKYSIDSEGIADGLQNASAALKVAGNDLNETISLITATNKIYQAPEEGANMLKVASMRLRGQVDALKEMGEDAEGVSTDITKIQQQIYELTGNKVNIFEDDENLKSTYQMVLEIGEAFESLGDRQQADLLEKMFGKQRASAGAALLLNYEELEKIKNDSMNADSSMQNEYNKYLESAEAHIATFKEKLVELYSTTMSGDLVKHTVDIGSAILDLVNSTDLLKHSLLAILALNVGKWAGAIGAGIFGTVKQMNTLGNALQRMKNLPSDNVLRNSTLEQLAKETEGLSEKNLKLLLSQKQLSEADRILILTTQGLKREEALAKLEKMNLTIATTAQTAANAAETTSTFTLAGAMSALKASAVGMWTSFKAMIASNPIGFALTALTTIISIASSAMSSANQELEEARESAREMVNSIKEEEDNLLSLIKRYNELDKTDRSTENTETIKDLNEQINQALGTQAEKIDLVNGKLDEQSDKLKRNLLQKLEDDKTELDTAASIAKSDYDAGLDEGMFGVDPWGSVSRALTENGATGIGNIGFNNVSDILRNLDTDQQIEQIKEWLEFLTKVDGGSGEYGDQLASLQSWYNDLIEKQNKYEETKEAQEKNKAQQKILNDSISGKISDFSAFEEYRNEIQKTYSDNSVFRDQMLEFIDNIYPEYAQQVRDTAKTVQDSAQNPSPISFTKAWNKLGTESDEDTAKESKEAKEELFELAEAGKLTVEAFENSPIAEQFLKDTGLLAEEATQEINNLIENVKQLDSMRAGINSITSAYDEKKDSKQHIVSSSTLNSMYDTLGIEKWDNTNKKVWENYKKCATDGKKSMADTKKAQDELATSFVNSNNFLANLDDTSDDYYRTLLTEMGVTNADTIVTNELAKKKGMAAIETADLTNMTSDEIAKLIEEKGTTDEARNAMKLFALEKVYANGKALDTTEDINQLINLMDSLGLASSAIKTYRDYLSGKFDSDISGLSAGLGVAMKAGAEDEFSKIQKKLKKKVKVGTSKVNTSEGNKTKDSKEKSKKDKTKETKTEIDWLSRRLTRMQSIIDLTAAKLQNLFSVKTKNSNLNRQIKQTNTLMKQYGIAADKYQKKADSVAKGYTTKIKSGKNKGKKKKVKPLSKDIINKIQSGKITKSSYSKLIKKYGQSNADRINKYIDYYDKAQDARKNKQDAKAKVRGLKQEKLQNWVDLYDSRTARAEAKESIQTKAKDKNEAIDTQIKNINKSYEKQKTIAEKISKDKAERDRLEYERQQKVKELQEQKLQNYVDEYNASADLASINSSNAIGYEKQNGFINEQLSYLKQSYDKQIEIAKLNGDITEEKRLQAEYDRKEVDLKQEQIDNLKKDYENRIGLINNDKQDVSNSLAETEARGDIVQAGFYSSLNSYENSVLATLKEELQRLQGEQNTFDIYSQEWYDLQSDIQSVENSISEANISIIENNKKIGDLRQAMYDDIAARNSDVSSEAQFLAGLLGDNLTDDKTGNLTKEGLGVLGTYGIELKANTNTAGARQTERKEIEDAIAAFNSGDAHALDIYGSLNTAEEKLNEVIKKQQEAISAEYDSMKNIYDLMVQKYDAQLAYMKSIIDAKKQVLDMEKDLYDYQKNIANQTKNIATLEKQLTSLSGDDSEEGRAKRAQLQVSLDEAQQNLQDTEYERYISDQQNMLDNMYTQYEDLLLALEKDFETVVQDGIKLINATAGGISQTLNSIAERYNYVTTGDMTRIMNSFKENGLTKLETIFNNLVEEIRKVYNGGNGNNGGSGGNGGSDNNNNGSNPTIGGGTPNRDEVIRQGYKDEVSLFLEEYSGESNKKPLRPVKEDETEDSFSSDLNKKLSQFGYVVKSGTGASGMRYINMFAQILGLMSGDSSFKSSGAVYQTLQKKYPNAGFRTGGIVRADGVPKDGDNIRVRVNPDETILTQDFTKMLPETVDTMKKFTKVTDYATPVRPVIIDGAIRNVPIDTDKLMKTFTENGANMSFPMKELIKVPDYASQVEPRQAETNQNILIDSIKLELPNVKDYRSFREELKEDIRSRRFFEACANDWARKGKITHNIQRF